MASDLGTVGPLPLPIVPGSGAGSEATSVVILGLARGFMGGSGGGDFFLLVVVEVAGGRPALIFRLTLPVGLRLSTKLAPVGLLLLVELLGSIGLSMTADGDDGGFGLGSGVEVVVVVVVT